MGTELAALGLEASIGRWFRMGGSSMAVHSQRVQGCGAGWKGSTGGSEAAPLSALQPEEKQKAAQQFSKLQTAMKVLAISPEEQKACWLILASIYHLGAAGATKGKGQPVLLPRMPRRSLPTVWFVLVPHTQLLPDNLLLPHAYFGLYPVSVLHTGAEG